MSGVVYDTGLEADHAVGLILMEADNSKKLVPLKGTYDKLKAHIAKNPASKLIDHKALWETEKAAREEAYEDTRDLASHAGARQYGHTAIMVRVGGEITNVAGFVPTQKKDAGWPCAGKWVDNSAMQKDPLAVSYEVGVTEDEAWMISDKLDALMGQAEGRHYDFKVQKTSVVDLNQGSYNCIAAALSVLKRTLPGQQSHWDFLIEKCTQVGYSQSRVKNGVITGWMDLAAT